MLCVVVLYIMLCGIVYLYGLVSCVSVKCKAVKYILLLSNGVVSLTMV